MSDSENMWQLPADINKVIATERREIAGAFVEVVRKMKAHRDQTYPREQRSPVMLVQYAILLGIVQKAIDTLTLPEEIREQLRKNSSTFAAGVNVIAGPPETTVPHIALVPDPVKS